jgi:hypothetical protein
MFHTYVEVFHLDVAYVCNSFQVFLQVFHMSFFSML